MPVNFNILQPIQPTNGVVANLPVIPASNPGAAAGGAGLSGLMQGMQQAQDMKYKSALITKTAQDTQQAAQLFPGQLQQQQQTIQSNKQTLESGGLDLQNKKQNAADKAELRKASIAGPDRYAQVLGQQDQGKLQDYNLKKVQVQQAVSTVASTDAGTEKAQLENYTTGINAMGQVARAAAAGANPEMQQKIYQYGVSQLPPRLQKLMPAQYEPNTAMAMSRLSHEANVAAYEKQTKTDDEKNLVARNTVMERIKTDVQAGRHPDPQDLQDLDYWNKTLAAKTAPKESDSISSLQAQRQALQDKIDNGTATELDKQSIKEITGKLKKNTTSTLYEKIGNAMDSVGDTVGGLKDKFSNSKTSMPPKFESGKIYKDANGNTAKYVDGKWEAQ